MSEALTSAITSGDVETVRALLADDPQLASARDAFLASLPDAGRPFEPEVAHLDSQRLEIRLHRSPYVRTWREAGVSETELGALTRISAAMWAGMFKGAGFRFVGKDVHDGSGDVHVLHIERTAPSHSERHADHPVGY